MRLRFTPQAVSNLEEIGDYIARHSPMAAVKVRAAILRSLERLLVFPFSGRRQSVEGVRKLVAPRYPYLVYYPVDEDRQEIIVLSIKHAAQRREPQDT
jgi:toxin ParE1/3/4